MFLSLGETQATREQFSKSHTRNPKDQVIDSERYHGSPKRRRGLVEFFFVVGLRLIAFAEGGVEPELRSPERFPSRVLVWGSLSCVASDVAVGMGSK